MSPRLCEGGRAPRPPIAQPVAGPLIYGYGSDYESRAAGFLASENGGRRWEERSVPEPIVSLGVDPDAPQRL